MDCQASGLPDPAVSWRLPDGTMVNSVLQGGERAGRARRLTVFDNGTLLVPTVGMGEEGEYTCYAENQGGQDTMKVKKMFILNHDYSLICVIYILIYTFCEKNIMLICNSIPEGQSKGDDDVCTNIQ